MVYCGIAWYFPGFFLGFPRYLPYLLRYRISIEKDAKHQVKTRWEVYSISIEMTWYSPGENLVFTRSAGCAGISEFCHFL